MSFRSAQGNMLVLVAFSMTMLLGFASVAVNAGMMFELRGRLSSVADAAAKAAALEVQRGNSANITAFAQREVTGAVSAGLIPQNVGVTTRLCSSGSATCTGAAASNANYVEVVLSKSQATLFGTFGTGSMTPTARAVAGTSTSPVCLYAMASSGVGIDVSNNANLNAANCSVLAGSSAAGAITVGNNGQIDATGGSVGTTGTCSVGNNGSVTPSCQTGVPPASDPLAGLATLSTAGSCTTVSVGNNGSATISGGLYCGISVSNNGTLTMNGGTYIMTGSSGLSLSNNATLHGSGVLIYNAGTGPIAFSNNATVALTAQTSGTYAGVLIFQPASNTTAFTLSNNGSFSLSGALYFPGANVNISNNGLISTDCSLVVAQHVTLGNNAVLTPTNTCAAYGGSPIHAVAMAE